MAKNDGNVLYDRVIGGLVYGFGISIFIGIMLDFFLYGIFGHDWSAFYSFHNFLISIKPWSQLGIILMVLFFFFNNTKKYYKDDGSYEVPKKEWGFKKGFIFCFVIAELFFVLTNFFAPSDVRADKSFSGFIFSTLTALIVAFIAALVVQAVVLLKRKFFK